MAEYLIQDTTLQNIANAIRDKFQLTDSLTPSQMKDAIDAYEIPTMTLPTLDNEGTASDLFFGKQLIDSSGNIITGTRGWHNTQKISGTFKTSTSGKTSAIVCGFQPDFVTIMSSLGEVCTIDFTNTGKTSGWIFLPEMNDDTYVAFYSFDISQTATGFQITLCEKVDLEFNWVTCKSTTFSYTAVKYLQEWE